MNWDLDYYRLMKIIIPTPESFTHQTIDQKLTAAGWIVQVYQALNLVVGAEVAVRD
jgi:hypothetical protein